MHNYLREQDSKGNWFKVYITNGSLPPVKPTTEQRAPSGRELSRIRQGPKVELTTPYLASLRQDCEICESAYRQDEILHVSGRLQAIAEHYFPKPLTLEARMMAVFGKSELLATHHLSLLLPFYDERQLCEAANISNPSKENLQLKNDAREEYEAQQLLKIGGRTVSGSGGTNWVTTTEGVPHRGGVNSYPDKGLGANIIRRLKDDVDTRSNYELQELPYIAAVSKTLILTYPPAALGGQSVFDTPHRVPSALYNFRFGKRSTVI